VFNYNFLLNFSKGVTLLAAWENLHGLTCFISDHNIILIKFFEFMESKTL